MFYLRFLCLYSWEIQTVILIVFLFLPCIFPFWCQGCNSFIKWGLFLLFFETVFTMNRDCLLFGRVSISSCKILSWYLWSKEREISSLQTEILWFSIPACLLAFGNHCSTLLLYEFDCSGYLILMKLKHYNYNISFHSGFYFRGILYRLVNWPLELLNSYLK